MAKQKYDKLFSRNKTRNRKAMKQALEEFIEQLKQHPNHWSYNWVIAELEEIIETYTR